MSGVIPQYPWSEGDPLFASALNDAIASGGGSGPFLPISGGTVTGQLCVAWPGITVPWSGAADVSGQLVVAPAYTGTSTNSNFAGPGIIKVGNPSDSVAMPGGNIAGIINYSSFDTGWDGARTAFQAQMFERTDTTTTLPTGPILSGASLVLVSDANTGGSGTGWGVTSFGKGGLFGAVFQTQLRANATWKNGTTGIEVDVTAAAGSSTAHSTGIVVIHQGAHAVQGLVTDTAFAITDQVGVIKGWKAGFTVGDYSSQWPIDPAGYLFQTRNGFSAASDTTVAGGFDLNQLKVTTSGSGTANADGSIKAPEGGGFFWRSPGCQVLDTALQVGYGLIGNGATSLTIDVPYRQMATAAGSITVNAGGANWTTGDVASDVYGNMVRVTASGGAVTGVSAVMTRGWQASPPADPVNFWSRTGVGASRGTGLKLNLIGWTAGASVSLGGTSAASVSIGRSAGAVGFHGATPVAKQTGVAVTIAAVHAALTNLGLIAP